LFLAVIIYSFGCFAQVKRLPGKIISEVAYSVLSGLLNPTHLSSTCAWISASVQYYIVALVHSVSVTSCDITPCCWVIFVK